MEATPPRDRITVEDFAGKIDSLYRLVIVAARRAAQLSKPDARALVERTSKKTTVTAMQEILAGKVEPRSNADVDEELFE